MVPERFEPVLREFAPLADRFRAAGHRLYLVGGTVRDLLVADGEAVTSTSTSTTDARPPEIKACVGGVGRRDLDPGREVRDDRRAEAQRSDGGRAPRPYEITTFRAEAYTDDSRKPHVVFADEIEADLSRRDFTVNAMALELTGDGDVPELVDPFDGAVDLLRRGSCGRRSGPTSASATIRCG